MMLSVRALLLTVALTLGLSACGDGDHREEDRPMPLPVPPTPVDAGTAGIVVPSPSRTADLVVINDYDAINITALYLSPSDRQSWGTNQLDTTLRPGADWTLTGIPCDDYYDLLVQRAGGVTITIVTDLYFACGYEKTLTLGAR
jgi:hypothetical protein